MKGELSLPIKAKFIWRARATLLMIAVMFVCGALAAFNIFLAIILSSLSVIIYLFIIIVYFNLRYEFEKYKITTLEIYIKKGVFFKEYTSFFKDDIQYVELTETPLQRKFNLCKLIFHMAGTKITIAQINIFTAEEIKRKIGCEKDEK